MTTAHRPQFDPARGTSEMAPTRITASRALPAHLKLKYRKAKQGTQEEVSKKDFRDQLLRAEAIHFANREHGVADDKHSEAPVAIEANPEAKADESEEKVDYEALLRKTLEEDADTSVSESESDSEVEGESNLPAEKRLKTLNEKTSDLSSSSSSDEDDDEEDETAQLLRELENIKQERQKEKEKQEMEEQREEQEKREREIAYGNVLLNNSSTSSFQVKRRWDEDVVFKNTHKGVDDQPKQGFVNDMLRSDFHKKFLARFVR